MEGSEKVRKEDDTLKGFRFDFSKIPVGIICSNCGVVTRWNSTNIYNTFKNTFKEGAKAERLKERERILKIIDENLDALNRYMKKTDEDALACEICGNYDYCENHCFEYRSSELAYNEIEELKQKIQEVKQ